jgi:hypothetical protein
LGDICFTPAQLALVAALGGILQTVIVTLFWLVIRSKDDSLKDARELRDRALDINEQQIQVGEKQTRAVARAVTRRGRS